MNPGKIEPSARYECRVCILPASRSQSDDGVEAIVLVCQVIAMVVTVDEDMVKKLQKLAGACHMKQAF